MGPIQSISEVIDFLYRRAGPIALASGLGLLLGIALALLGTPTYQATTVLSTRVDTVSDEAVRAGSAAPQSRLLQLVEQRLTSRENLLRLADSHGLFEGQRSQHRVDMMRESITLISQPAVNIGFGADGSLASIIIMARANSSDKAAAIANQLADMVITETGAGRMARARETLDFLRVEQERLQGDLRAVEAEAREFAAENFDAMPFNATVRRTEQASLVASIQETRTQISSIEAELAASGTQAASQRRQAQLRESLSARRAELEQLQTERDELTPYFRRAAQVERDLDAFELAEERLRDRLSDIDAQIASAEGALRLEEDARSTAFEVLERAEPPEYPISRARRVTAMLGLVGGGLLGLLAAFGYEVLRPTLRSVGQLERETGMRPVLVLPALVSDAERRRVRRGWIAGVALLALSLLALLTFYGS